MELIALLSTGKGTWGHVGRLMQEQEWDKIVLLTNDFGKENFKNDKNAELIVIDARKSMLDLVTEIAAELKSKVKGKDVGVNLISGSGKEHMALLAALAKNRTTYRLMALTTEGVKEL